MAKYNTGFKYNYTATTGGALYDSARFVLLIKLFEAVHVNENISDIVVENILREKANVFDEAVQYAINSFKDSFSFEDIAKSFAKYSLKDKFKIEDTFKDLAVKNILREKAKLSEEKTQKAYTTVKDEVSLKDNEKTIALLKLAEKFNFKDELTDLIVLLYLNDKTKLLDEFKELNAVIAKNEGVKLEEINDLDALVKTAEEFDLNDIAKIFAELKLKSEKIYATDKKPRKAISDFLIGYSNEYDRAYQWFQPLPMLVDFGRSSIQVMPQAESTYIEMPYMDGAIRENTVYKNRLFNLVLWSKENLNTAEKEQLKADIVRVLDSTKKKTKKLTIQSTNTSFDTFYAGEANIRELPTSINATIPLEVSAYGYPLFEQEVFGSGLLVNGGDTDATIINTIGSGCENPSFQIGDITYSWHGTVPVNAKLVINHGDSRCYLENTEGKRTNALQNFEGEFQKIPKNTTMQITALGNAESYLKTVVKEYVLWKKD